VDRGGADRTSDRGWGAVVGAADGDRGRGGCLLSNGDRGREN
jgi:hypothetical protein